MAFKHVVLLSAALLCLLQANDAGRLAPRSLAQNMENFDADQVETFVPASSPSNTICMPRLRWESALRVIDTTKTLLKTMDSYMQTCANLSSTIRANSLN